MVLPLRLNNFFNTGHFMFSFFKCPIPGYIHCSGYDESADAFSEHCGKSDAGK
jgi:hypothetical protein